MTDPAFILRVLKVIADADMRDNLFWRVDGDEVKFGIICNDTFDWGSADMEELTPGNIGMLEKAITDANAIGESAYADLLFCVRARNRSPMPQYMAKLAARPKFVELLKAYWAVTA